jgi:pyruvate-ferredoxin/flavodoxin oxidoreductase
MDSVAAVTLMTRDQIEDPTRSKPLACLDGNEAAARVAHKLSEVIAIYPITPASAMGEAADAWSAAGRPNLWGAVPEVIEMQSEAGAAGVLHGAAIKGALATTFTASQGLLLMLPNMFKVSGELTPAVIHVAARTVATHALSIFGDHSDVMAVRAAGWAMLASSSVQEAHDLAAVAHLATLRSRVPFLHFFDGFRTSHEIDRIEVLSDDDLLSLIDPAWIQAHRARGLSPDRPVLRGSAQNPDVFFQAREAASPFYDAVPKVVQQTMDELAARTGRAYHLVEYHGAPDATRVIVLMGSGAGAVQEAVDALVAGGETVGMATIRLFRPFPAQALLEALPSSVRSVAVLDRTKEPGATGEPLYQDVIVALAEGEQDGLRFDGRPAVIGGRYGLSSKEFTPAMAKGIFDEMAKERPRNHFTVGIVDDVSHTSLAPDPDFATDDAEVRAVFYGLGSDGTVGANKNSVKIVGEGSDRFAQGYFVIDSKKSGSVTVSHLRFSSRPIHSTYLIRRASFVACHQFSLLQRMDVLKEAEAEATFLLNSPYGPDDVWDHLPLEVRATIRERSLDLWVVDAYAVAREAGLGRRINTVMQPCFFALSKVLPMDDALVAIKAAIQKAYGKLGEAVVERNVQAVDQAIGALHRVEIPAADGADGQPRRPVVPPEAPDFVQRVTARMMAGEGDLLPVSALPVDGTFPTGTARWEKRSIAQDLPVWDPTICIDCAKCVIVCPHAAIQMKVVEPAALAGAPSGFQTKPFGHRDDGLLLSIQIAPDDCTGCGVCADVCPARSKSEVRHKSLDMEPATPHVERERENFAFFLDLPSADAGLALDTVKGSQARPPLFEFSGACAGCGETPYLKLLTQLFGDRLLIANATGCSSIYGGNLPTTPWSANAEGRGPAWANSLFEDNAEFGLGMRLALDRQVARARQLLEQLAPAVGSDLSAEILAADQNDQTGIDAQRERIIELEHRLAGLDRPQAVEARELLDLADELVAKSVWIVGGDGWAYDIGSAGLDHVLASGRNVNVLVLDTEVYSNTGGQASKSTPRGAVAKFAAQGKPTGKKDLGIISTAYGNVYVAQIAMGANEMQTVRALLEAEAWPGPSLVIAYSTCIAHGIDMATSMTHQKDAVRSGHWPLYRFHPGTDAHPFQLDSKQPSIPLKDFARQEARFAILERTRPERFAQLMEEGQADVAERWRLYEQLAGVQRTAPDLPTGGEPNGNGSAEPPEEEPA